MEAVANDLMKLSRKPFETATTIKPRPGYCYKTTVENNRGRSEPPPTYTVGCNVYINICHSDSLPSPKIASEADIQKAMMAAPGATYQIPLSLGQPRQLVDSESRRHVIMDACIHTQPFVRSEHDLDFRLYILELAMEHIEEALSVDLSRQFTMLKVAAKGAPIPKRILYLPEPSSAESASVLISNKLDTKETSSPLTPSIVPQVTVQSWRCQPVFKQDSRFLKVILQMPSFTTTTATTPWNIRIDDSCLLLKGVDHDNVIDIMLPITIDAASTSNRAEYFKKSGHLVISLAITTVRERYL